jgi:hypothetical protein
VLLLSVYYLNCIFYPDTFVVVNKNIELRSPWFKPRSKQLCVSVHYYTHSNAGRGSMQVQLDVEHGHHSVRITVKDLEHSEVSFILNAHIYCIYGGK